MTTALSEKRQFPDTSTCIRAVCETDHPSPSLTYPRVPLHRFINRHRVPSAGQPPRIPLRRRGKEGQAQGRWRWREDRRRWREDRRQPRPQIPGKGQGGFCLPDRDPQDHPLSLKVRKVTPTGKELIKNINLGMYLGAKIILGANGGAGKSTLMKILAGVDKEFDGEIYLDDGIKVGYLPQEPPLDDGETVMENIEVGVAAVKKDIDEYNQIAMDMTDPDCDMDKLMARMDALQTKLDATNAWEIDRTVERAMDALRCPPGDALVKNLSGRRTPRGHLPSAPRAARHHAPGRAHEPPGRGERGVAREVPRHVHGHRRRDHARPLLPGQRRGVDPRARPRRGHPVRGQLQRLVGVQVQAAGIRAEEAGRAVANDQPGAGG